MPRTKIPCPSGAFLPAAGCSGLLPGKAWPRCPSVPARPALCWRNQWRRLWLDKRGSKFLRSGWAPQAPALPRGTKIAETSKCGENGKFRRAGRAGWRGRCRMDAGGSGTMGAPGRTSRVSLPGITRLALSVETAAGRGDDLWDPPGPRTEPGRQSSPSRPSPSPRLPSLGLPLELPGRFFFPLYKEKAQRARVSLSRSFGLELFHQSQSSSGGGRSQAGCKGKARKSASLCWHGRDGSSPSIPLIWGCAGQTS